LSGVTRSDHKNLSKFSVKQGLIVGSGHRALESGNIEAVFSFEDPLPGIAELALLPYSFMKRGF
jgi:hypothetical protein